MADATNFPSPAHDDCSGEYGNGSGSSTFARMAGLFRTTPLNVIGALLIRSLCFLWLTDCVITQNGRKSTYVYCSMTSHSQMFAFLSEGKIVIRGRKRDLYLLLCSVIVLEFSFYTCKYNKASTLVFKIRWRLYYSKSKTRYCSVTE